MQSAAVSGRPVFGLGSETVPRGRCARTSFGNGMTFFAGSNVISPASTIVNVQTIGMSLRSVETGGAASASRIGL